ncbi:hypothetical protein GCM10018952_37930 [Streptosporangium vulgare]
MISPALMNVALHGMEQAAGVRYWDGDTMRATPQCPILVRYADDLIALCHTREQAEQVKARLSGWLAPRGLVLNEDKTRITHLDQGVDFLGFEIRRFRGKLLTKPSKDALRRIRRRLSTEVKALRGSNADAVIARLNPIIRGWAAYYRMGVSKRAFNALDAYVWRAGPQVGHDLPPEQVEAVGDRPLLRHVQPLQAGQVGVREPGNRVLSPQVHLDKDRSAPDGGGTGVPRRPGPG